MPLAQLWEEERESKIRRARTLSRMHAAACTLFPSTQLSVRCGSAVVVCWCCSFCWFALGVGRFRPRVPSLCMQPRACPHSMRGSAPHPCTHTHATSLLRRFAVRRWELPSANPQSSLPPLVPLGRE